MVFKCKDSKEVEPVEVSISQDDEDTDIWLDDMRVAYFEGDSGKLVLLQKNFEEVEKLKAKGVKFDGDRIAIVR
jgi:hypothetical protein